MTEIEVKGKMKERTGWQRQSESQIRGEDKRNGRLVGAGETSKELAQWHRLQQKNLSVLGVLKKKEWMPQTEQLASTPEPSLPKGKETEDSESQSKKQSHLDELSEN